MDAKRAKKILGEVWGNGGNLTPELASEIEWEQSRIKPGEVQQSYLYTLQLIAGDDYDWASEPNWEARRQHFAKYL